MLGFSVIGGCLLISGCASVTVGPNERSAVGVPPGTAVPPAATGKGGYYLDDGPGENAPDLAAIPDAAPKVESLHRAAMRPYSVLGRDYTPMTSLGPYRARGIATWYGKRYHGKSTSTGERYDMYGMTAAHTTLPLPSYARVTSIDTGRSVIVRVNDRGPFKADRLIDLSYAAAWKLGLIGAGSGLVEVESIVPDDSSPAAEATSALAPSAAADNDTPAPIAATTGVFLQLGAFSEAAFADDFARKMRVELPDLTQPVGVVAGDKLHRVQSGPFPDRESARREADRIAGRLGSRPFVVTR